MFRKLYSAIVVASVLILNSCSLSADESDEAVSKGSDQGLTRLNAEDLPDEFRFVFYNVENLFDTHDDPKKRDDEFTPDGSKQWNGKRYQKKLQNISEVLEAMEHREHLPLIIGLAEIENRGVLEDLRDKLLSSGQDYGIVHKDSKDMRGIDLGLLYDKSSIAFVDEEFLRIEFPKRGTNSRDILHFTGALAGEEVFHVFLNHWPSRREGVSKSEPRRIAAARTLKNAVDKLQHNTPEEEIIIMGDFNDYPSNKSLSDELDAAHKISSKNALNNLSYSFEKRGLGTSVYKGKWNTLDQAIVSGNLIDDKGFELSDAGLEIFSEEFILFYDKRAKSSKPNRTYGGNKYYGGYSDHLPIMLNLTFSD